MQAPVGTRPSLSKWAQSRHSAVGRACLCPASAVHKYTCLPWRFRDRDLHKGSERSAAPLPGARSLRHPCCARSRAKRYAVRDALGWTEAGGNGGSRSEPEKPSHALFGANSEHPLYVEQMVTPAPRCGDLPGHPRSHTDKANRGGHASLVVHPTKPQHDPSLVAS